MWQTLFETPKLLYAQIRYIDVKIDLSKPTGEVKSVLRLDYYQLYKICNNTLVFSSGIYFISKKRKKKSILLSHYHEISYKPLNQDKYPVSQLIRNLVLELTNIWAKSVCTFIWVSLLIVEEHLLLLTYLFL